MLRIKTLKTYSMSMSMSIFFNVPMFSMFNVNLQTLIMNPFMTDVPKASCEKKGIFVVLWLARWAAAGQAILIRTFPDIFLPSFVFTLQNKWS